MPDVPRHQFEHVPLKDVGRIRLAAFLRRASVANPGEHWADGYAADAADEFDVNRKEFGEKVKAAAEAHHKLPKAEREAPGHDWSEWYAVHMLAAE